MSREGGGTFTPVLREVGKDLALPIPGQVRILRELQADLEELTDRLVDEGLSPAEARGRALEALVPDPETLAALEHLHTPLYRRLTRRFSSRKVMFAERTALGLAAGSVLVVQTLTLLRADLLRNRSPYLALVLLAGAGLFALILWKAFHLWVKGDHTRPDRGLGTILGASAGILCMSFVALVLDLYRLAVRLEGAPGMAVELASGWLIGNSALVAIATILAMAGGLAWFILSQWVASVSGARREILGLGPAAHFEGAEDHDC